MVADCSKLCVAVCWLLFDVGWLLFCVVCCSSLLRVVCCLLCVVGGLLLFACCLLAVRCLLFVVGLGRLFVVGGCWLLFVVCNVLSVVCCSLFVG